MLCPTEAENCFKSYCDNNICMETASAGVTCDCDHYDISGYTDSNGEIAKTNFEAFWNDYTANPTAVPMYEDYVIAFMECDVDGDGVIDAADIDAKIAADPTMGPQCSTEMNCPTENFGDYLLCTYNNGEPFDDAYDMNFEYIRYDFENNQINWTNCECFECPEEEQEEDEDENPDEDEIPDEDENQDEDETPDDEELPDDEDLPDGDEGEETEPIEPHNNAVTTLEEMNDWTDL